MPRPLLVVDAPSLLYRAFHALPDSITDDEGRPVNALLGTINIVLREIAEHGPRAVVLCFGVDAAHYRVELFAGYHAERPPVPDGLAPQFAVAPSLFEAFGWYVASSEEFEADDLLHSYAAVETDAGGETLLLTGDRDMFQCAGERVKVLYVRTGSKGAELVGADEVKRRYGVAPELVPDFIALRGDPSDGIPGAKGIGEKTAAALLGRHGSLEGAIAGALRESAPRVRGALREQAQELRRFRQMAELRRLPVERPADRETDTDGAAAAVLERGMRRLAERLGG